MRGKFIVILWGVIWGVILGTLAWKWGGLMGGIIGLLMGWTLQLAVRSEIAAARTKLAGAPAEPRRGSLPAVIRDPQEATPAATAEAIPSAAMAPMPAPASVQPTARPEPERAQAASAPVAVAAAPRVVEPPAAMPRETRPDANVWDEDENDPTLDVFASARDWLLGGNTIVRVGLVILFIGLSFLVRYAATVGLLPIELRLAAVGAAAIALLALGFAKRESRPDFALLLQGGGVAVLYLTVFAAFRLYGLMPTGVAFGLMIVICGLSCALALLQNARALAVAAFAGGFAVPLLLSTGSGSHIGLFSYYALLNLAILFIAGQRSWRILNVVGFIATFGVATSWGVLKYQPEHYASAQFFLLLFVVIYLLTAVLYARNTPTRLGNAVDSMLVFGTPLIGFGLQAGLVREFEMGSAFSALGFAGLYLGTALLLARRRDSAQQVLIECLTAVGVGFATLAVPLALDARWTSAVWALEGAGAFWAGRRQARWLPRAFGLLLQLVAGAIFVLTILTHANVAPWPLANPAFLGALFIALPALALALWLREPLAHGGSRWAQAWACFEPRLASPLYLYAFGFWVLGWVLEAGRRLPPLELGLPALPVFEQGTAQLLALLAFVASAALSHRLARRVDWPVAVRPSQLTLAALILGLLLQLASGHRVLDNLGWLLWPLLLALHYRMLWHNDGLAAGVEPRVNAVYARPFAWTHIIGAWLITGLLADILWFAIDAGQLWHTAWAGVVLLVSSIAVLMALVLWAGRANQAAQRGRFGWPLQPHAPAYYAAAAQPLALLVCCGALIVALTSSGRTDPLPYVPLLNPTDLSVALGIGALLFWRRVLLSEKPASSCAAMGRTPLAVLALVALGFIALNTVWLRIAHHYFDVYWSARALFASATVQTGYAILWTLLALGLMLLANRRGRRTLWLLGASLLAVVVVKLLLIDLSHAGSAARIIAFIGVGVLMLVVGYLAPLPPKDADDAQDDEENPA